MKLILGAVQFGLEYGVANRSGKPNSDETFKTFDVAWDNNIRALDSAQAYGQANEVIGHYHNASSNRFSIINKIMRHPEDLAKVLLSLADELKMMNIERFDCVMFHHAASVPPNLSQSFLDDLKASGMTARVGLSIEIPEDYYSLQNRFHFDVVQLPLNILNQNFIPDTFLGELKENNVEIHARSAFMQGLLLEKTSDIPAYLKALTPNINDFQSDCKAQGIALATGCLLYLLQKNAIDHIVVGAQNAGQLKEIIEAFKSADTALLEGKNLRWADYACPDYNLVHPLSWLAMKNQ